MVDQHVSGFLFALLGAILFSLKPVFIKLAYTFGIDTVSLLTLRMLMALPFYLIIGLWEINRYKQSLFDIKHNIMPTILIGMLGYYLASYLDLVGLTLITAQLERLILFTYPTMVVVLGAVFFNKDVTPNIWRALLLTYSGIASIVAHDISGIGESVIEGVVLVFFSAISFALFMLLSHAQIKRIGSVLFTAIGMSGASIAIISHFSLTHSFDQLSISSNLLGIVLGIAVLSTVIPSFLISAAINKIGAGKTSMIGSIGPVITALLAVNVLDEAFTIYHLIGMILVVAGVSQLRTKRNRLTG